MKKSFALRTASMAIAMSLAGAANAQTAPAPMEGEAHEAVPSTLDLQVTVDEVSGDSEGAVVPLSLTPSYRDINPFYRDINPFYRDINAFWGHINPFYRDINPFYRDINPFYRDINPFYGDITAFWGDINPFYRDIIAFDSERLEALGEFWQTSSAQVEATDAMWDRLVYRESGNSYQLTYDGTPNKILNELEKLIAQAEAQFGSAYEAETGKSFRDDFVTELLARHGVDLNDKVSLAGMTAAKRAALFLDWHDSLMEYSGIDHIDHWMAAVNWTPAITQIQSDHGRSVIGIIDSHFSGNTGNGRTVLNAGGTTNELNGHGAGVASLIGAAHDGEGVMGIAPNATITAYNPFDHNGTASWDDVADGIVELKRRDGGVLNSILGRSNLASVVNLSLGEPGLVAAQGFADILARPDIQRFSGDTVYVAAAGNDGVTQTQDVEWSFSTDRWSRQRSSTNAVIFVGSIDPTGEISEFSNRPGSACLLDNGVCHDGNQLMYNFVVAPGELLLVSDGQGGVVRRSGTSFAAPLVSGAIALLHDFWPWLNYYPEETAEIIFRSARDLGETGVDEVYGWGLLDVAASQSPLDFNNLQLRLYQRNGNSHTSRPISGAQLLNTGIETWWENEDVFFTMFEQIGSTWRDFQVPMSSATYGTRSGALGELLYMQDFISARFGRWLNSGGVDSNGDGAAGITQLATDDREISGGWGLRYDAVMPRFTDEGVVDMVHTAATLEAPNGAFAITVGHGEGAMALAGGDGFGLMHDYDRYTGGVNPVLGFASGETFFAADYRLGKNTQVSLGYSENRRTANEIPGISDAQRFALSSLTPHSASAMTVTLEQKLTKAITLNGQWTNLREDEALLGVQSTLPGGLDRGTQTDAFTLSANVELGSGFTLDLSSTGARTEAQDGQIFATSQGVFSTAGQVALSKHGVLGNRDKLRVSIAQPLNVEAGSVEFTSEEVVNRDTGETGLVTQSIDISTKRRIATEVIYGAALSDTSQVGLFGHYLSEGNPGEEETFVIGANFGLRF